MSSPRSCTVSLAAVLACVLSPPLSLGATPASGASIAPEASPGFAPAPPVVPPAATPAPPGLSPPAPASAGERVLTVEGDTIRFVVDPESGALVADLLEAGQEVLGVTFHYAPSQIGDRRFFLLGRQTCSRAEFRGVFDGILLRHGFLTHDEVAGGSPVVSIFSLAHAAGPRPQELMGLGQVVPADRLDTVPARSTATYTTVFRLRFVDARSMLGTLNGYLEGPVGALRSVERSNSLLATTTSIETLRLIRDVIAATDVEPPGHSADESCTERLEELETRVDELEAVLETISEAR